MGGVFIKIRVYSCVLLALIISFMLPVYGAEKFNDVPASSWAYSHINRISDLGIIKGYEDGSFRPQNEVSYAEFIKMIYISCFGGELEQPKNSHWALNYYSDGIKAGIFTVNDVKLSDLDKAIPREKMALMISQSIGLSDRKKISLGNYLDEIKDVNEDSDYAYEIAISYSEGILNGYPDGSFRAQGKLSRAEAACAICRYLDKYGDFSDRVKPSGRLSVKNRGYEADLYEASIGYNGIKGFKYSQESDCIGVYSDRIQDITLFIDGNKTMPVVSDKDVFWREDGYYVYVFDVKEFYKKDSDIGISFGLYIDEIFIYKDARL